MKNKLFPLLVSILAIGGLTYSLNNHSEASEVKAEELSISSTGDSFVLLPNYYGPNESFVYTADLHFRSGQAGGLAFGSEENNHYYVINMDRYHNQIKLLYFASNGLGGYTPKELYVDYFIGNDKMTDSEKHVVEPQVRGIENVNIKVILTKEETHAYAEFYVEGIKRFGVDTVIDLNAQETPQYQGGYLGMNCFASDVYLENIEIGKSDYSYFSEPYRNQYHLQPFAKWSNDPNALVYHNGYYHVFYQFHPFGLQWGPMYWGHARSRDLIHFEFLPVCLFPDDGTMGTGAGKGYMWSGCAVDYKLGMSHDLDALNWFPNNGGNGIYAILTRECPIAQDQLIITSDDGGMTWTKRRIIPQSLSGVSDRHIDWRDPKIFPLRKEGSSVLLWGMTLSGMNSSTGWFLSSTNLLDWEAAGTFKFPRPECVGVGYLMDENNIEHAYLTNKSRSYIFGTMSYNYTTHKVEFIDETNHNIMSYQSADDVPLKPLDFGPDTYASQSFYIDDANSEFNGKDIVLNWFSGDLNASFCTGPGEYAGLRGRWNGGFTIPVEYGVKNTEDGLRMTQKPVTVNNTNLEKTNLVNISNQDINNESENPLNDVHTHIFELEASFTVNNNSPITFKVDVGENEYMEFGWNQTDGYYVDRTNLDDKGINTNIDWHAKYASHILGETSEKTFYVLSDNGGLEVFCEDYSVSFYFVTTASMYSRDASLEADDAHINYLRLNEVKSVYRQNVASDEGLLYVSNTDVKLDTKLSTAKYITCWYSGTSNLVWQEVENNGVVSYTSSNQGINFVSLQPGTATFKVTAGNQEKTINVTVCSSSFSSEFTFEPENIVSGNWVMENDSVVGEKSSGNGFLLAAEEGSDFTLTGQFDIVEGNAGALVFRAAEDMSAYLVANYDSNEHIVKLWSTHGELARSYVIQLEKTNIVLTVKANGKNINIAANGIDAINYTLQDNEPLTGRFGLNVFSSTVKFRSLSILRENYSYSSGDLAVGLQINQYVKEVYNITKGNLKLEQGFYHQSPNTLYIHESYFALLENGTYRFKIVSSGSSFYINVEVNASHTFVIEDVEVETGVNVNIYVGANEVSSVKVNNTLIEAEKYHVKNYTLTIDSSCFKEGDNEVLVNDSISFNVKVVNKGEKMKEKGKANNTPLIVGLSVGGGVLLIGAAVAVILIIKRKKGAKA